MITCNKIIKKYDENLVLDKFSYIFPDKGFILLFGESGCGKTTLINILAGIIGFESGLVTFSNYGQYNEKVDSSLIKHEIAYITQDALLINQLSILENLYLVSDDKNLIDEYMKQFRISEIKDLYPESISGGEKQRVVITMALLQEKKIIILDEPTAALDEENKRIVFEELDKLSEEVLIICSSHDYLSKEYADDIIYMNSTLPHNSNLLNEQQLYTESAEKIDTHKSSKKLIHSFFNMDKYPNREKKSSLILFFIILVTIITIGLCDTPTNKINSNVKYTYKLNQLTVWHDNIEGTFYDLVNEKGVKDVNLVYALSEFEEESYNDSESCMVTSDFISCYTLPDSIDTLNIENPILYGTYFSDLDQIILPYNTAINMGNPNTLIGETMNVKFFDGNHTLKIVGVLREFTEIEKQYFLASSIDLDNIPMDSFIVSSSFMKKYEADLLYKKGGRCCSIVYFDNFKNMYKTYKKYEKVDQSLSMNYAKISVDITSLFNNMCIFIYPIVLMTLIISFLFYFQTKKIETCHNQKIYGTLLYIGYTPRQLQMIASVKEAFKLLIIELVATVIYVIFMIGFNVINQKYLFFPFQVFSFNFILFLLFYLITIVFGAILTGNSVRKVSKLGWYHSLISNRDLI